jgi:hypothetical protein
VAGIPAIARRSRKADPHLGMRKIRAQAGVYAAVSHQKHHCIGKWQRRLRQRPGSPLPRLNAEPSAGRKLAVPARPAGRCRASTGERCPRNAKQAKVSAGLRTACEVITTAFPFVTSTDTSPRDRRARRPWRHDADKPTVGIRLTSRYYLLRELPVDIVKRVIQGSRRLSGAR